jgi:hypothetical protein
MLIFIFILHMCFSKKLMWIHLHFIILIIILYYWCKSRKEPCVEDWWCHHIEKKNSFEDDLNTKKQINDGHSNEVTMVKCDIEPQGVGTSLQRSLWRKMMVLQCMGCLMQSMNLIQMIVFKRMSLVIHRMLGEK